MANDYFIPSSSTDARLGVVGRQIVDQLPVFAGAGPALVSGLVAADFNVQTYIEGVEAAIPFDGDIEEIDSTGNYRFRFTPGGPGHHVIHVGNNVNDELFGGYYDIRPSAGLRLDPADPFWKRLLGLGHENVFVDNTEWDECSQLTAARVRVFCSADTANAATDGGDETDGLVASYEVTQTWQAPNVLKEFRQVLTLSVAQVTAGLDLNLA